MPNSPDRPATTDAPNGWWVPTPQYWRQTLLPRTGCWQWVRTADGKERKALVLAGMEGWFDTNYQPLADVAEWLKPSRWFRDRADLEGKRDEMEAARRSAGSVLRRQA